MKHNIYNYLILENVVEVCEGIIERMKKFPNWKSIGFCIDVYNAIEKIKKYRPQLIFMDWDLNGGSAYEVLEHIQNLKNYNPYIIFNTGFQSDNPEIPEEITNRYNVDIYLVKPYWDKLRKNLINYLKEAEIKFQMSGTKSLEVWVRDVNNRKMKLPIDKIVCVIKNPNNSRRKDFFISIAAYPITLKMNWQDCYELLKNHKIEFYITNKKEHLVIKQFVENYKRPYVRLKNFSSKLEVVKERIPGFTRWIGPERTK